MNGSYLTGLVPLIPLLGFLLISMAGKSMPRSLINGIACGSVLTSFILSSILFFELRSPGNAGLLTFHAFDWIPAGTMQVAFNLVVDPLSLLMMLVITGIGFLIHVYSIGYMHHDPGYHRFFACLNLFIFFMLILVMGSNLLILFIGWEGVGLSSYLLIGFWYTNTAYNNAAKKAFIMNRIGDLGLILSIFLVFTHFGTLEFSEILSRAREYPQGTPWITAITLLLFVGAIGKSAQIPLHTWLPDAMAGPTPVSALIHAATMVTAGVYLIARNQFLFSLSPVTLQVVLWIGLATSLMGALIATRQNDIKKILAYSTISQLGLMFVAHGLQASSSAMFHMLTHAFFKALLFLAAGSVIHALHGQQDIHHMGGLRKQLPVTGITFLLGALAITGLPPFSGFFSKDAILIHAFQHSYLIWILTSLSSLLTAFYMFRLYFLAFGGNPNPEHKSIHESPLTMTGPLVGLAVLSLAGGFFNLPILLGGDEQLKHFLSPVLNEFSHDGVNAYTASQEIILMVIAVAIAVGSAGLAYSFYIRGSVRKKEEEAPSRFWDKLLSKKFYIDELYDGLIVMPIRDMSQFIFRVIDQKIINQLVNNYGFIVKESGLKLRGLQSGNTGFYILLMVIGMICILISSALITRI